jgi:hypothetical protein
MPEDGLGDGVLGMAGDLALELIGSRARGVAKVVLQHYRAPREAPPQAMRLALEMRRSQLDALEHVRLGHAQLLQALPSAGDPGKYRDEAAFNALLARYVRERRQPLRDGLVDVATLSDRDVADLLRWAVHQAQAGAGAAASRAASESQMLAEITAELQPTVPGHFERRFRDPAVGWHAFWTQGFQRQLDDDRALADQMLRAQNAAGLVQGDELKALILLVLERLPALAPPAPAPATLPQPFNFSQLLQAKTRHFHGRRRLLAEIEHWVADTSARERVVALHAPFGAGKSSLMAELCRRRLQQHGTATVVHFCRWDQERTLEPGHIVRSLAAQFARNLPGYAARLAREAALRDLLDERAALLQPVHAWQSGVVVPLSELAGADAPRPGEVHLLLIDGVDESTERTQAGESLLTLIGKAAHGRQLPPWLRMVLASRPDERLAALGTAVRVVDLLHAAASDQQADLRGFIAERCQALAAGPLAPATLDALGRTPEQLIDAVCAMSDGRFLVAEQVFDFIESRDFSPLALAQLLDQARAVPGIESFLDWSFRERVRRQGHDVALTRDVLGIVAAARDPLTTPALAAVLRGDGQVAPDADAVRKVLQSLGGLVVERPPGSGQGLSGWTFAHKSIEDWLDPASPHNRTGLRRPAGDYAIDRAQAQRRIEAACWSVARSAAPRAAAAEFWPYVVRWGVRHLMQGGHLAAAISLLAHQLEAEADPQRPGGTFRVAEAEVIEQLRLRFRRLDEPHARPDAELPRLDSAALRQLLHVREYQTGKYQPLIRALAQYHAEDWEAFRDELLEDDNDLVLRNDIGVAMARAWHAAPKSTARTRLAQIVALSQHAEGSPQREIAGYAIKHICQRIEPAPWWQGSAALQQEIRALLARHAASSSATDRMVAGEALLALAIQDVDVRAWVAPEVGVFWQPRWPNLQADVDAIHALLAPGEAAAAGAAPGLASVLAQQALAARLGQALRGDPLFAAGAVLADQQDLRETLWPMAHQQCGKEYVGDALCELLALGDAPQGFAFDVVRLLMLHPLWDVGECGANLLADLVKQSQGRCMAWVDALMESDEAHWRLRYGAVDAAFTAGTVDGYAKFREVVVVAGMADAQRDPYGRVRGICADDLYAYLERQDRAQRRLLLAPGQPLARLVAHWLATADDIWLLEYLHALMRMLSADRHAQAEVVEPLMRAPLAPALPHLPGTPFYTLDADEFLRRVEDQRSRALGR